eukprot:2757287-Pyramimonas_sp.AAC.1
MGRQYEYFEVYFEGPHLGMVPRNRGLQLLQQRALRRHSACPRRMHAAGQVRHKVLQAHAAYAGGAEH